MDCTLKFFLGIFAAAMLALAAAHASAAETTYTLYRNSVLDNAARIHVGSFDAAEGATYNRDNCALVADLMQRQPGTKTRFWCELGRHRK